MSSTRETAGQILFQNSLAEVVRQLRANKNKEREVAEECLNKCKSELRSTATSVKVTAVVKLTYFSMLGYSSDHGAFNVIEVMSDPLFQNKRVGYVAAAVTFHEGLDLLPLITAQVKKDLMSQNHYEIGLALYCISCVCTPDLARDLVSDVVGLLNHQRAYVRKKAILCLYKIFLQYPEALRPTYPKLKEKLDDNSDRSDNDPSVRGAVVNVLCELARRNPANFLNLVVPFFTLLSTVHNNWTLIKIIKVFGHFAPLEPRLGKKLVEPITNLINTSPAKSVQYECIYAVANGMSKVQALTKLAAEKMKLFAEEADQNLKYLGLDAMSKIIQENPKLLQDQRDTVLACLDDEDITIRKKALELLYGLSTRKNIVSNINAMFDRVERFPPDEDWSNMVIAKIIETAQTDDYALISDFEWYLGVLLDLTLIQLSNFKHGNEINNEIVTVMTRVNAVRQFGVENMAGLLSNDLLLNCDPERSNQWMVLKAAAFVCGEYPHWILNKKATVGELLHERINHLPAELQVLCVGAAGKIHAFMKHPSTRHLELIDGEEECELPEDATTLDDINELVLAPLPKDETEPAKGLARFALSALPDVQEKAAFVSYLATKAPETAYAYYEAELPAVAEGAQKFVTIPENLDLDTPFADMPELLTGADSGSDFEDTSDDDTSDDEGYDLEAKIEATKNAAKQRRKDVDEYYLKGDTSSPIREEDLPPVEELDLGKKKSHRDKAAGRKVHSMSKTLAGPKGYTGESKSKRSSSPVEDEATRRLKHITVGGKLEKGEELYEIKPYERPGGEKSPGREASQASGFYGDAEETSPPLFSGDYCDVRFDFKVCHAKKDVLSITLNVTVVNNKESHSIYNPTLTTDTEANGDIKFTNGVDPAVSSVQLADKIKGGQAEAAEAVMSWYAPVGFEPIPITLTFVCEKREKKVEFTWAPTVKMVLKAVEEMPSDDFAANIVPPMAEAPCMSAEVGIHKKLKPAVAVERIKQELKIVTVDTFKDCVSFYGRLVIKKSAAQEKGHLTVLLMETSSPKKMTVVTKCHNPHIAEAAIQEIAALLAEK